MRTLFFLFALASLLAGCTYDRTKIPRVGEVDGGVDPGDGAVRCDPFRVTPCSAMTTCGARIVVSGDETIAFETRCVVPSANGVGLPCRGPNECSEPLACVFEEGASQGECQAFCEARGSCPSPLVCRDDLAPLFVYQGREGYRCERP